MASLVCRYKGALSFIEIGMDGVIGYDTSRDCFKSLEKSLNPLINYCAKLVAGKNLGRKKENLLSIHLKKYWYQKIELSLLGNLGFSCVFKSLH